MKDSFVLLGYSDLIESTDRDLKKNFLLIFILGLMAGIGRFVQEDGAGEISASTHGILEILVNLARLLIIFVIIGQGYLQAGFNNFMNILRLKTNNWHEVWANVKYNFSNNFPAILVNFIIYVIIAGIINIALFALFEYTSFMAWLKSTELISPAVSEWPVLLLLKNISIIPFTLVFETRFVMWIVERNKLIE